MSGLKGLMISIRAKGFVSVRAKGIDDKCQGKRINKYQGKMEQSMLWQNRSINVKAKVINKCQGKRGQSVFKRQVGIENVSEG